MPSACRVAGTPSRDTASANTRQPREVCARICFSAATREKGATLSPCNSSATNGNRRSGAPKRNVTRSRPPRLTAAYLRALSKGRRPSTLLPAGVGCVMTLSNNARAVAFPPSAAGAPCSSLPTVASLPKRSAKGISPDARSRSRVSSESVAVRSPGKSNACTRILPSVSVPVLSVKSRFMLPAVSIPTGLRTST